MVCGKLELQQIVVSGDDAEHIVEIVCDAARQPSDSFHFVRLAELIFHQLPLGDVFVHSFVADGYAALADGPTSGREPHLAAVFTVELNLEGVHYAALFQQLLKFAPARRVNV